MTTELQRAMARYEDARIQYKKAVLSSLNGASGDAIRDSIQEFQKASADLRKLTGAPPRITASVQKPRVADPPRTERAVAGTSFFRRLLNAS